MTLFLAVVASVGLIGLFLAFIMLLGVMTYGWGNW